MSSPGILLFDYPRQAYFGRVVPKRKIYEHAAASTALKKLFVHQVDQIIWAFKLSPETLNISATKTVSEIQIFRIALKGPQLDQRVLQAIDRAIPFPILFELSYRGQTKLVAAYKRPHETDSTRWVLSLYFETDWQPEDAPRQPLPVALNLSVLYEQLLIPLVKAESAATGDQDAGPQSATTAAPHAKDATGRYAVNRPAPTLTLEQQIALAEAIAAKQKEIDRIHARLKREKQFNKRVAINTELREAKQQLARLQAGQPATSNR
ncbi:DUF4391 domain-containing protein [Microbulbifer thermotolerans]|uniref:Methyl-accepting chemotaxis protein n=1 Tax=Microbulbifer thermotolerans TaxID=252514 RepID=A0A143HQA7_MICTH|nr:DUF4391 domain-containing protein [Microbulbifer thermotolerans]AMX03914.1 methyl-accepting chemotaxis protein [Microbulbifer thermotolerans]